MLLYPIPTELTQVDMSALIENDALLLQQGPLQSAREVASFSADASPCIDDAMPRQEGGATMQGPTHRASAVQHAEVESDLSIGDDVPARDEGNDIVNALKKGGGHIAPRPT